MGLIYETVWKLRNEYKFFGYIHVKAIPGASEDIIEKVGFVADRMSVNLELPTKEGLQQLAPNKNYTNILKPMKQIQMGSGRLISDGKEGYQIVTRTGRKNNSKFVPAGQSTQMIIGATPETDYQLMSVTETMYKQFNLKRVFYSAFVDVNHNIDSPAIIGPNPMLREHRLYQADWLLRYYGFGVKELLNKEHPNFNVALDPKCDWAVNHLDKFPVEVMRADYYTLLRVPGIGVKSARRITAARHYGMLDFNSLKKMGVVLKRAAYFITCGGKTMIPLSMDQDALARTLADTDRKQVYAIENDTTYKQMTLMDLGLKQ
jgi:putative DNA modification/repair radical SAM protein